MTIEEQHYDFKRKLNKIDSQKYRNMLVPEIDQIINEAREIFVKRIAQPRRYSHLGTEMNTRNTQDLRTLVVSGATIAVTDNQATVPDDFWFPLRVRATISTSTCPPVSAKVFMRQHDDNFIGSSFDKSNYNWRTVNGTWNAAGILFDDGDNAVTINTAVVDYYQKLTWVHNAAAFNNGSYTLPGGQSLTGKQDDTQLPDHVHREVVDIAVLLAKGELESQAYQLSTAKINLNDIV